MTAMPVLYPVEIRPLRREYEPYINDRAEEFVEVRIWVSREHLDGIVRKGRMLVVEQE